MSRSSNIRSMFQALSKDRNAQCRVVMDVSENCPNENNSGDGDGEETQIIIESDELIFDENESYNLILEDKKFDGLILNESNYTVLKIGSEDEDDFREVYLADDTSYSDSSALVQTVSRNAHYTPLKFPRRNVVCPSGKSIIAEHSIDNDVITEKVPVKTEKNKIFNCTYENCCKSYTSPHHLKVHTRVHTGDRPFKCTSLNCTKAFSTGFGLKIHRRTHNNERPYKCLHCSCLKQFKTSGDLQKHIRIHTGERPFLCPVEGCGRAFTTGNICKVHIRTHTGERPYKCTYSGCSKTFASLTNQRNHLRIHSGERPYVCSVVECGRTFTEYSSLYKHNQVHRHVMFGCPYCSTAYNSLDFLKAHVATHQSIDEDSLVDE